MQTSPLLATSSKPQQSQKIRMLACLSVLDLGVFLDGSVDDCDEIERGFGPHSVPAVPIVSLVVPVTFLGIPDVLAVFPFAVVNGDASVLLDVECRYLDCHCSAFLLRVYRETIADNRADFSSIVSAYEASSVRLSRVVTLQFTLDDVAWSAQNLVVFLPIVAVIAVDVINF